MCEIQVKLTCLCIGNLIVMTYTHIVVAYVTCGAEQIIVNIVNTVYHKFSCRFATVRDFIYFQLILLQFLPTTGNAESDG